MNIMHAVMKSAFMIPMQPVPHPVKQWAREHAMQLAQIAVQSLTVLHQTYVLQIAQQT